jgi:hypothetical protein
MYLGCVPLAVYLSHLCICLKKLVPWPCISCDKNLFFGTKIVDLVSGFNSEFNLLLKNLNFGHFNWLVIGLTYI